jgi:hypothetical protein
MDSFVNRVDSVLEKFIESLITGERAPMFERGTQDLAPNNRIQTSSSQVKDNAAVKAIDTWLAG